MRGEGNLRSEEVWGILAGNTEIKEENWKEENAK
jgi:hypothetical protein